jgi:membrane-associated protease RseP (regulator of RpoE activity)
MEAAGMRPDRFSEKDIEVDSGFTLELLRSTIQKYFIVNDVRHDDEAYAFFIQLDPRTLEGDFDDLRREMLDLGFIPMLLKEKPGYIIYVTHKPEKTYRSINVNLIFLIATIITTIIAGMSFVASYEDLPFWSLENAGKGALYFALPLMFILGLHEMGHYFMARRHRVAASLPFFIPAPPILGTFGAFISLREPIHSKRALLDIGFAGPIVGFIAALFVTVLGLKLSAWDPHPVGDDASAYFILGTPLVYDLLTRLVPTPVDVLIHPTAFAGWVGFLVTFLNLLPAGQLDGGHIVRALFGDRSKYVSWVTVAGMVFIAWYFGYVGWIVFIIFILFVLQHPPPLNDISPLPPDRWAVGFSAFLLLMVCFVPAPFVPPDLNAEIEVELEDPDLNVALGSSVNATMLIHNTGNTRVTVQMELVEDHGWNFTFHRGKNLTISKRDPDLVFVNAGRFRSTNFTTTVDMTITPREGAGLYERVDFTLEVAYEDENEKVKVLRPKLTVTVGWLEPTTQDGLVEVGTPTAIPISFRNWVFHSNGTDTLWDVGLEIPGDLDYTLTNDSVENLTAVQVGQLEPMAQVGLGNNDTADLLVWVFAPNGTPQTLDVPVNLTVTLAEDPTKEFDLSFIVDVVPALYNVSLIAFSNAYYFDYSAMETKYIPFRVISNSTVPVSFAITYEFDENNWTATEKDEVGSLEPGESKDFHIILAIEGEVGARSDLVVTVDFGYKPLQVVIALRIT